MDTNGAGKGDTPRPINKVKFDIEYDRIFKKPLPKDLPEPTTGVSSSVFEAFKLAHFNATEWLDISFKRSSEQHLMDIIEKVADYKKIKVTLDQKCDDLSNKFLRSRDIPDDIET